MRLDGVESSSYLIEILEEELPLINASTAVDVREQDPYPLAAAKVL